MISSLEETVTIRKKQPNRPAFDGLTYVQTAALTRIMRLESEIIEEASYWTTTDCLSKMNQIKNLMDKHFPGQWEVLEKKQIENKNKTEETKSWVGYQIGGSHGDCSSQVSTGSQRYNR